MPADSLLDVYNQQADKAWQKLIELLGIHTVAVLVRRSIWLTRQKYSEAALIELGDAGFSFSNLDVIDPDTAKVVLDEFLASLVAILARLVGRKVSGRLLADLDRLIALEEGA